MDDPSGFSKSMFSFKCICVHTCACMYRHLHVCVCVHAWVCIRAHSCTGTCMCVCVCTRMGVYTCMRLRACVYIDARVFHVYMCVCVRVCVQKATQFPNFFSHISPSLHTQTLPPKVPAQLLPTSGPPSDPHPPGITFHLRNTQTVRLRGPEERWQRGMQS